MSLDLLSTDEALRLECARIASARGDVDPARAAARLYDFVKGIDRIAALKALKDAADALR